MEKLGHGEWNQENNKIRVTGRIVDRSCFDCLWEYSSANNDIQFGKLDKNLTKRNGWAWEDTRECTKSCTELASYNSISWNTEGDRDLADEKQNRIQHFNAVSEHTDFIKGETGEGNPPGSNGQHNRGNQLVYRDIKR